MQLSRREGIFVGGALSRDGTLLEVKSFHSMRVEDFEKRATPSRNNDKVHNLSISRFALTVHRFDDDTFH